MSGQELGNRLTDPERWRRGYLVAYRRFRRLDRVRAVHGKRRRNGWVNAGLPIDCGST